MNYRWIVAVLPLLMVNAFASSWETSSFRTDSGALVRLGMSKSEVRRGAGAPLNREKTTSRSKSGDKPAKKSKKKKKQGEVWTYRGYDGVYAITFLDGVVNTIDVTPNRF